MDILFRKIASVRKEKVEKDIKSKYRSVFFVRVIVFLQRIRRLSNDRKIISSASERVDGDALRKNLKMHYLIIYIGGGRTNKRINTARKKFLQSVGRQDGQREDINDYVAECWIYCFFFGCSLRDLIRLR